MLKLFTFILILFYLSSLIRCLGHSIVLKTSFLVWNKKSFKVQVERNLLNHSGQDVNDVLTAIDHVIDMGHTNPSKITLFGGSHGGFLTTHFIGQVL